MASASQVEYIDDTMLVISSPEVCVCLSAILTGKVRHGCIPFYFSATQLRQRSDYRLWRLLGLFSKVDCAHLVLREIKHEPGERGVPDYAPVKACAGMENV